MILRDINERKQMEEALHESEERLRTVIANVRSCYSRWTRGSFTLAEGRGLGALVLNPGMAGKSIFDVFAMHLSCSDSVRQALTALRSPPGGLRAGLTRSGIRPLRDLNNVVSGVIGVAVGYQRTKDAELALRKAKDEAETLVRPRASFSLT